MEVAWHHASCDLHRRASSPGRGHVCFGLWDSHRSRTLISSMFHRCGPVRTNAAVLNKQVKRIKSSLEDTYLLVFFAISVWCVLIINRFSVCVTLLCLKVVLSSILGRLHTHKWWVFNCIWIYQTSFMLLKAFRFSAELCTFIHWSVSYILWCQCCFSDGSLRKLLNVCLML